MTASSQDSAPPVCEHWIFGNIVVEERGGLTHTYERAVLVTFKTADEMKAAINFMQPIFESQQNSTTEGKQQ